MALPVRLPKWFDPRLYEGASRIHGRGIFTREPVRAGEVLMRWGGLLVPLAGYDPARYRPSSTTLYDESHWLATPADEPVTLDEFFNHSCDPNTWMTDEVTVIARRAIRAHEELTTDFALWSDAGYVYTARCLCGTDLCRGTITGDDCELPNIAARYRGHMIPCVERRVTAARRS